MADGRALAEVLRVVDKMGAVGRWSSVVEIAEEALVTHPESAPLHSMLSRAGLEVGRPELTIESSNALLDLTVLTIAQTRRWAVAAAQLNDGLEVRAALQGLVRSHFDLPPKFVEFYELARRFGDSRVAGELRRRCDSLELRELDVVDARLQGRSDTARALLDAAIEADPTHVAFWLERGRLRLAGDDPMGALADGKSASKLEPESRPIRNLVVRSSVRCLPSDELVGIFDAALAHPGEAPSSYLLSAEHLLLGEGSPQQALKRTKQAFDAYPNHVSVRTAYAMSLAQSGQLAAAETIVEETVAQNPWHRGARLAMAQVAQRLGQTEKQLSIVNEIFSSDGLCGLASTSPEHHLAPKFLKPHGNLTMSTDTRLVSVIMTAFGYDDLLPVAIDSILDQSHSNLELIVVDDCSDDDTFSYLIERATQDERLRPFQMPRNGGTYAAKNLGIRQSRGEFVAFMDSDDYSHPQRLEWQIREFDRDERRAMVSHEYFRVSGDSDIEFRAGVGTRMAHISPMVKRHVIETVGYFDRVRVGADSEFIRRIEILFGEQNHSLIKAPLLVVTAQVTSLTGGGPFEISWRGVTGPRMKYRAAYSDWHHKIRLGIELGYLPYAPEERPFSAPESMIR